MGKIDLDWGNLDFAYRKTDCYIRYTYRNGQWDDGELSEDTTLPLHVAATSIHYGQACFEGLKAFTTKSGDVAVFRVDENAKRMRRSCDKLMMQSVPEDVFIDAVMRVIDANRAYVPPYGTGASLYIRPLTIGTGANIGVKPADEYMFIVFVSPVGPYFKTGFKPVKLIVETEVDRAAPLGVGDVKAAGNYAAGLRATMKAKKAGYTEVLYLDAIEKRYIDESGPANFFAITRDGQYVTAQSPSILPSITNKSLITLANEMGLRPERRRIDVEEIFSFIEAGCCGTAAVITPVGSITYGDRVKVFAPDGQPGKHCTALYNELIGIQHGDIEDRHNWLTKVPSREPVTT